MLTGPGPGEIYGPHVRGWNYDGSAAGRGSAPDADTEVKVFTYDGSTVSQWISLETYPGLSQGTNVTAGRF